MQHTNEPTDTRAVLMAALASEFRPERLIPSFSASVVVAMLNIFVAVTFAALIFSGDLSDRVSNGIGLLLVGAAVSGILVSLFSTLPGTVSGNQSLTAAIMVTLTAGISRDIPATEAANTLFPTVVISMILTGLLFGLFCLLLGQLELGNLVRFLPYTVIGGFLAGMGWFLVRGAVELMTGASLGLGNVGVLLQPAVLMRWLPALLFAVLLLVLLSRVDKFFVLPGMIIGAIALFYIVIWINGASVEELVAEDWLLGALSEESLWQPWPWAAFNRVDWGAVSRQLPNIGALLLISMVSLLLNASGLEVAAQRDVVLNQELKANGLANVGIGLFGGMAGYLHLSFTTIGLRMNGDSRLTGFFAAAIYMLALTAGTSVILLLPKMVMGGLLLFLGLSFLKRWVYDAWFQLSRLEYITILIILVVIAGVGFLEGVAVGVVVAIIFFAFTYSRVDVIRHELNGQHLSSRVTRSPKVRQRLWEEGWRLFALQLQGYIFFGTADRLIRHVQQRLDPANGTSPQFVLLDFRRVIGLDSTAMSSLKKLKQLLSRRQVRLMISEMTAVRDQLQQGGLAPDDTVHYFETLDQATEWYEEELLQQLGITITGEPATLLQQLATLLPEANQLEALIPYLEKLETEAGDYLMFEGDQPDYLYFVESGQVTAQLEHPDRPPLRLETMSSGRVVGEMGFYLGQARTASVVVDLPGTVYRLTWSVLQRVEEEQPSAAAALHQLIAVLLAQRATHLVSAVNALER